VTLAEQLAAFAAQTAFEAIPDAVVTSVKQRFLDTIGVALAASSRGLADGVLDVVGADGGLAASTVIGTDRKVPAAAAAIANGTLAHSLDFDDTHLPSVLHPSATIVPAVLALSEALGASGSDAIRAATIGIETTVRLGLGGFVHGEGNVFFERGWHATSICGTLGAAASSSVLLGLDEGHVADALGIAASFAGGLLEANRSGGTVKRLHCGWAAHAGIFAARLAAAGFTSPRTVLEGRFGLFQAFLDNHADPDAVVAQLGQRWEVPGIAFKPYPANHYTHAAIDAALLLRTRHHVRPDDIERLELGTSEAELRTIGEPREQKIRPQSGYHAQFSGPFAVATALHGGGGLGVYFEDFTDAKANDQDLLALAAKVETFVDEECDKAFPYKLPAVLRAHLKGGRVIEERVMNPRGTPGNPLSESDLLQKFSLNAGQALNRANVDRLAAEVLALEGQTSIGSVLALTRSEITPGTSS
jgi:2-methylcitrate dehydratase PrpD